MELIEISELTPPLPNPEIMEQPNNNEYSAPSRKRQKQDLSNMKPVRTSGRIRIKMDTAACNNNNNCAPDENIVKKITLSNSNNNTNNNNNNNNNITKSKRKPKKVKNGDSIVTDLNIDIKKPNNNVLIMFDVSIRALLTNFAFTKLSPENQKILIESLPLVDRPNAPSNDTECIELKPSSINNEFFNRACIEWRERLSNGEFTNDFQTKLRAEHEKEKSKIDPWKARNFEGIWGFKSSPHSSVNVGEIIEKSALEMKGIVEQGDFEIPEGFINEVWKNDGDESDPISIETRHLSTSSPSLESPQLPSISTTVPTPPEIVTSTQPELAESPPSQSRHNNPQSDSSESISSELPAIAISSADSTVLIDKDCALPSTSSEYTVDDEYSGDVANQVELSSDGSQLTPSPWYLHHQQEHDYLKNIIEPEPSGMEEVDEMVDNDMELIEEEMDNENVNDDDESVGIIETDSEYNDVMNSFANSYENSNFHLQQHQQQQQQQHQQEVVRKTEILSNFTTTNNQQNLLIKNFVHQQEPLVVRQVGSGSSGFNTVIMQKKQPSTVCKLGLQNSESFLIDEADLEQQNYQDEIQMTTMPKKIVTFPTHTKMNEKIIIEDSICLPQQQQQQIHTQTSTFRTTNGTSTIQPMQNSFIVGNQNFTYIPKITTNKVEQSNETARIIKNHEANNNQSQQIKQRIIYEIASDPKVSYDQTSHQLAYSTQSQPEIFHQLIKHPNGTTTIYETTAPPPKKTTIIQRKKNDPFTIILTPISNATQQQTIQNQSQKSILHIHQSTPIIQANSSSVQFIANPPTFVKKQTVIHPQKVQPKFTTVIRAPSVVPNAQIITTAASPKIQKPIQKQKVIMSTSSLQQYRNFNQKPSAGSHGPRKQLHPQHIVRSTPNTIIESTQHQINHSNIIHHPAPTIIHHHQILQDPKSNQIPVILPNQNTEQILIPNQMPPSQPTVVISPQQPIFVRQKRPQQIFQQHQPQINGNHTIITASVSQNQQQQQQQQQQLQQQQQQQQLLQQQQQQQARARQIVNNKTPPGSVNLERSYQICQAVIQNSSNPNRQQLNNQLKVPNFMAQKKF